MSRRKIIVIAAVVVILVLGAVARLVSLSDKRPGYADPPVDESSDVLQL